MEKPNWITTWTGNNDPRYAVRYDGSKVTANDGDVCLSFVTYKYLRECKDPYCLDIGADQCWWSIFCCEQNPNTKADAFEPKGASPEYTAHLQAKYPSISLHPYAISDVSGSLPFTYTGSDSHSRDESSERVPCRPIDPFLERCEKVDMIKIDTEGHEIQILSTIVPWRRKIGVLVFECSMYWYGSSLNEALSKMMKLFAEFHDTHPYIYMLSRRGEPTLYDLSNEETLLQQLYYSYHNTLQFDCLLSRTPFVLGGASSQ